MKQKETDAGERKNTRKGSEREGMLLADEVAQGITERIQSGYYKAGQRLPVRALCEEFGTSETPVKQALNQLVTTGLVDSIPKCGMRVHAYELKDIRENLEARLMIELYCAHFAVELAKRDEDFVSRVEEAFLETTRLDELCIEEFTRENYNRISEPDHRMHRSLVESCRNEQIIRMYADLNTHKNMFIGFEGHSPDSLRQTIGEHRQIMEALLRGNEAALRKATEEHITTTLLVQREAWKRRAGS